MEFKPWPYFTSDEIDAVTTVLQSGKVNYWTGEEGRLFEQEFAAYIDCKYAVALANGTVALELALHALGVGPGDEIIVPARTFIATASAVVMRGATPVVADVDPVSQNLTIDTIKAVISERTKAIIAVHLAGWPCDMDPILDFATERGVFVIEDCAQAHGARYKGKPVGSIGDIGAFSFCQDKIMTTGGEGGMLTTNNKQYWEKAWAYKDHGKNYVAVYEREHPPGFRWLHESFGTNWRMTEMQAAIGRVQLAKLSGWVAQRRDNAAILLRGMQQIKGLRCVKPEESSYNSYYKFYVFVKPDRLRSGWSRDRIITEINQRGVPCFSGSCSEIYLEKAFSNLWGVPAGRLPVAKQLGETSLMFLVHPTLMPKDMDSMLQNSLAVIQAALH